MSEYLRRGNISTPANTDISPAGTTEIGVSVAVAQKASAFQTLLSAVAKE